MLCVIDIQAVLSYGDLKSSPQARRGAKLLYEALRSQYQMVALSAVDPAITRWWLRSNFMNEWSLTKTWERDVWDDYIEWKQHEIAGFLASGWEIGVVIDSYPGLLVAVGRMGVMTMLVQHPAMGPGFSDPSRPLRAWDTVGTEPGGDNGPG